MIELIAGGARSGKSNYALKIAKEIGGKQSDGAYIFIATATAHDQEMAQRIARHQASRSAVWQLIEEPLYLAEALAGYAQNDIIIVDCLTLWLTNWLSSPTADQWDSEIEKFLDRLKQSNATILLITNEVGMGVVPLGRLSRDFVDTSGLMHQAIAEIADRVSLIQFGIASRLK